MHVLTTTPMAKSEYMFSQKIGKDFTSVMINFLMMPLSPQNQHKVIDRLKQRKFKVKMHRQA